MEQVQEFNVGDSVTFNAYKGRAIKAKVLEALPSFSPFELDGRTAYRLEGTRQPLTSICTGCSIQESQYFKEPTEF